MDNCRKFYDASMVTLLMAPSVRFSFHRIVRALNNDIRDLLADNLWNILQPVVPKIHGTVLQDSFIPV